MDLVKNLFPNQGYQLTRNLLKILSSHLSQISRDECVVTIMKTREGDMYEISMSPVYRVCLTGRKRNPANITFLLYHIAIMHKDRLFDSVKDTKDENNQMIMKDGHLFCKSEIVPGVYQFKRFGALRRWIKLC